VHGIPVVVNPESMLMKNSMGRAALGMKIEVGYNTKEVTLLQTKA